MYAAFLLSSILYAHICSSKVEDQISLNAEIARATKRLSFEDVLSGSLRPEFTNLQWTSTGKDGSYFETNQTTGDLWLAHVLDDERQLLVNGSELQSLIREKIVDRHVSIHEHKLQPGGTKVLVSTNHTKLYRWSGFADLYVYDPSTGSIYVLDEDQASDIRYARWSPTGDSIAYVRHNNLYINQDGKNIKITNDGSADIFNGVPDWVYEEEIFASTNTMWYSPDGRYIAFLKFNDTGVPIYRVPYYMTGQKATAYPRELELKYPKAGQVIPTVSLHLVDLDNIDKGPQDLDSDSFAPEDLVIGEVTWITDNHSHLAWRCLNRIQDHDELIILDVLNKTTFIATERTEPKGWIDNVQSIRYLPGMNCFVYLSDKDGWSHIFLHYLNGTDSLQLTKGKWEVTQILYVNSDTVFYQSTERDSTERHIYSLDLNSLRKTALVDDTVPGVYRASFSSEGGYYILSYLGPKLPRQALYSVQDSTKAIRVLQNNSVLFEKLSKYNLPQSRWTTIKHPDGFELNVLETLPPDFDVKRSYPLLLNPYGGPGSQQTAKTYHGADWWAYIASDPSLEYVVLTVDGRGTGFKGNTFGHTVTGKLGMNIDHERWSYTNISQATMKH